MLLLADQLAAATTREEVTRILQINTAALAEHLQAAMAARAPAEPPPYHIPGPYEIALAVGAALAGSGRYDTPGAALQAGWAAVPEFFAGRDYYVQVLAPGIYAAGQASPLSQEDSYVGGEQH